MSRLWLVRLVLVTVSCCAAPSWAEEQAGTTTVASTPLADVEPSVVTQDGLRFNVPADWPIEKHGAAVGPIAVEDYMVRKFKMVEARLEAAEQRVAELERQVKTLKAAGSSPAGALRSTATQTSMSGPTKKTAVQPPVVTAVPATPEPVVTPAVTPADTSPDP